MPVDYSKIRLPRLSDEEIRMIFEAIRQLMIPPDKPNRQIGFRVEEPKAKYRIKRFK